MHTPRDAEFRLRRQRTELILTQPFFGALALRLPIREVDSSVTPTMATDGRALFFYRPYVDETPDAQLRGVIVHEVLHCVLDHVGRLLGRDADRWNRACDYAINPLVTAAGFTLPAGCLDDPAFHGLSADQIYARLPETPPGGGGGNDCTQPGGILAPQPGAGVDPATDAAQLAQDWRVAAEQARTSDRLQRGAGKLPADLDRALGALLRPQADWRDLLRRFVDPLSRGDYAWHRPNRRYIASGLILPGPVPTETGPIAVCVDTSASLDDGSLSRLLSELNAIIDDVAPERVDCIACDTRVRGSRSFDRGDWLARDGWLAGGGGTRFSPALAAVAPDVQAIVYLTDGECSDYGPPPHAPVVWATVGNRDHRPPFGDVVHLD
jgi:predicted metal-dependent peptidase